MSTNPKAPAQGGVYYGWVVAAVTFLTMLVTAGAVGAPGVLIAPFEREFGWSNAEISSALAVRLVLFGLLGPFAAAFMNRFGVRRVASVALVLIALGIAGSFAMSRVWHLLLFWGLVVGVGTGLTAMVLGATVATRWFVARRGLVLGLLSASTATGQLVFLPLLAALTERYGWRAALSLILAMLLVATVAVLVLMRDRPSDLGLRPYGATGDAPPPPRQGFAAMLASPLVALREASGSVTFWVLFGTFFVCGASTNGLVQTHFVSLCGDYGIGTVTAAGLLAVIGLFDLVGTIGSGWLSDRYDCRWLLFWYYGLRGLSLLYLPFSDFSFTGLSVFAVFYGLDWVATVPPTVKLTADRFGSNANLVFGWIFAGHQLGAATAAYGAGFSRTVYETYLPAFFAAGALCLFASAALMLIRDRRPVAAAAASA
ncbi:MULTISPECIES: MFS transporter [unclassified Methylobacterium]|uniref:MFS transporter n=1 Tax=unclassified Methylobacterium TaxID=2615210 RepID=UPI0036F82E8F